MAMGLGFSGYVNQENKALALFKTLHWL